MTRSSLQAKHDHIRVHFANPPMKNVEKTDSVRILLYIYDQVLKSIKKVFFNICLHESFKEEEKDAHKNRTVPILLVLSTNPKRKYIFLKN